MTEFRLDGGRRAPGAARRGSPISVPPVVAHALALGLSGADITPSSRSWHPCRRQPFAGRVRWGPEGQGVTTVSPGCHDGVARVSRWCRQGVTMVSRVSPGRHQGVTMVPRGVRRCGDTVASSTRRWVRGFILSERPNWCSLPRGRPAAAGRLIQASSRPAGRALAGSAAGCGSRALPGERV